MKKTGALVLGFIMVIASGSVAADTTIEDIMPVLKRAKADTSSALKDIDNDLAAAAKKLSIIDLKSDEARKILAGICKDKPYAADCSIIDTAGKLSVVEPESSKAYEGRDISFEASVKELIKSRAPLMSNIFQCLDGVNRVDIEYPIINANGEFLGAVSLLVNHETFLGGILSSAPGNRPCKVWAMQPDGMVLYDQDPEQVNKNIFTDPMFEQFSDLISFSRTVAASSSGAGSYEFYKEGMKDKVVVKKDAAWDTVRLYGSQWRIVVMEVEPGQGTGK